MSFRLPTDQLSQRPRVSGVSTWRSARHRSCRPSRQRRHVGMQVPRVGVEARDLSLDGARDRRMAVADVRDVVARVQVLRSRLVDQRAPPPFDDQQRIGIGVGKAHGLAKMLPSNFENGVFVGSGEFLHVIWSPPSPALLGCGESLLTGGGSKRVSKFWVF